MTPQQQYEIIGVLTDALRIIDNPEVRRALKAWDVMVNTLGPFDDETDRLRLRLQRIGQIVDD